MFRQNKKMFNVGTSYTDSLEGYTMQLEKRDTDEYRQAEAKAAKIATEIEKNSSSKMRTEIENGDEEDAFSAVTRENNCSHIPRDNNSRKYLPPQKRQGPPRSQRQNIGHSPSSQHPGQNQRNSNTQGGTSPHSPTTGMNNSVPHLLQHNIQQDYIHPSQSAGIQPYVPNQT